MHDTNRFPSQAAAFLRRHWFMLLVVGGLFAVHWLNSITTRTLSIHADRMAAIEQLPGREGLPGFNEVWQEYPVETMSFGGDVERIATTLGLAGKARGGGAATRADVPHELRQGPPVAVKADPAGGEVPTESRRHLVLVDISTSPVEATGKTSEVDASVSDTPPPPRISAEPVSEFVLLEDVASPGLSEPSPEGDEHATPVERGTYHLGLLLVLKGPDFPRTVSISEWETGDRFAGASFLLTRESDDPYATYKDAWEKANTVDGRFGRMGRVFLRDTDLDRLELRWRCRRADGRLTAWTSFTLAARGRTAPQLLVRTADLLEIAGHRSGLLTPASGDVAGPRFLGDGFLLYLRDRGSPITLEVGDELEIDIGTPIEELRTRYRAGYRPGLGRAVPLTSTARLP